MTNNDALKKALPTTLATDQSYSCCAWKNCAQVGVELGESSYVRMYVPSQYRCTGMVPAHVKTDGGVPVNWGRGSD